MAAVEDGTDEREDVGDGGGGPGLPIDREQADAQHGDVEAGHLLGRQIEVVHPQLPGPSQDVVVHIGDVADQPRLVPGVPEPPLEQIERQVHLNVTHVGTVIRGDSARVHGDDRSGLERDHTLPGRVVETHHGVGSPVRAGTRLLPSSPDRPRVLWALYRMFRETSTAVNASMVAAWASPPASRGRTPAI